MTTKTLFRDILTVIGLSIVLTIFITHPGFSQDTTKTKGDKKVRIIAKVITDKDGKTQEFDTTINLNRDLKPGEEKELLGDFEKRFGDLGDQMKHLEIEMNDMNLPDSGMMDSIQQLTEKAMKLSGHMGKYHFRHNISPHAYNYNFDFDIPDVPEPPQPLIEEFDDDAPGMLHDRIQGMMNNREGSLNSVLGDIPMDHVKSYSIKETKHGKRITIELNDEPLIERQEKVIIMRSPRPEMRHRQNQRHQIQKRIIIRQGDQEKKDSEKEEQQDKM